MQDEGARRGSVDDGEVIEEEKERMDEQRYEEAITELKRERDREFRSQLVVSFSLFLVFWLVGAAAFSALEGWCVRLPPLALPPLALPPLEALLQSTSSARSRTTSPLTLAFRQVVLDRLLLRLRHVELDRLRRFQPVDAGRASFLLCVGYRRGRHPDGAFL